jgi:hypothetical protein
MTRRLVPVLALAACLLIAPAATGAGQVKRGNYSCSYYAGSYYIFAGTLRILDSDTYRINEGRRHPYRYTARTKHINFLKGEYKPLFGRYSPSGGSITIHKKSNGRQLWTCTKVGG